MSADLLRRAASLMRERAEAATPGPWRFTDAETVADVWDGGLVVVNPNRDPIANVSDQWYESDPDEPAPVDDARHIASWHPAVALAVADWLEHAAARAESKIQHGGKESPVWSHERDALAVARAYLGESA